jgi:hypothetical protein
MARSFLKSFMHFGANNCGLRLLLITGLHNRIKSLYGAFFIPTALGYVVSNDIPERGSLLTSFTLKNNCMIESPYFFLLILFVMGYGWHSLLLRFRKKED